MFTSRDADINSIIPWKKLKEQMDRDSEKQYIKEELASYVIGKICGKVILCERKDDKERVELGVFPNISSITKDTNATIYVTRGVLRKLRLVHHIYNGVEFVTKLLKNCDFAAPYKKDEGIINFYRQWITEHGKARVFLAGLAVKDSTITTCFPPTPTAYKEAEKNKIELK